MDSIWWELLYPFLPSYPLAAYTYRLILALSAQCVFVCALAHTIHIIVRTGRANPASSYYPSTDSSIGSIGSKILLVACDNSSSNGMIPLLSPCGSFPRVQPRSDDGVRELEEGTVLGGQLDAIFELPPSMLPSLPTSPSASSYLNASVDYDHNTGPDINPSSDVIVLSGSASPPAASANPAGADTSGVNGVHRELAMLITIMVVLLAFCTAFEWYVIQTAWHWARAQREIAMYGVEGWRRREQRTRAIIRERWERRRGAELREGRVRVWLLGVLGGGSRQGTIHT